MGWKQRYVPFITNAPLQFLVFLNEETPCCYEIIKFILYKVTKRQNNDIYLPCTSPHTVFSFFEALTCSIQNNDTGRQFVFIRLGWWCLLWIARRLSVFRKIILTPSLSFLKIFMAKSIHVIVQTLLLSM